MSASRQAKWKRDPTTNKGKKFKVYQDPITQNDYEGIATVVIEFTAPTAEGFQLCEVLFDDEPDGRKYQRVIHPKNEIK